MSMNNWETKFIRPDFSPIVLMWRVKWIFKILKDYTMIRWNSIWSSCSSRTISWDWRIRSSRKLLLRIRAILMKREWKLLKSIIIKMLMEWVLRKSRDWLSGAQLWSWSWKKCMIRIKINRQLPKKSFIPHRETISNSSHID